MNRKYFVPPDGETDDFKVLFRRLAAAGAGRPVDKDGFPSGPWTSELLADAITQLDGNSGNIELRTVQLWFQDNDRGISPENIKWLARIFGCGNRDATSSWQVELHRANIRLGEKRRKKRVADRQRVDERTDPDPDPVTAPAVTLPDVEPVPGVQRGSRRPGLAILSENVFSGQPPLNVMILLWAGFMALAVGAYVTNVESVRYSPIAGISKQVGFLWAPSWTILPTIILPMFVALVMTLVKSWRRSGCHSTDANGTEIASGSDGWLDRVQLYAPLFWAMFVMSFFVVFLLQWSGIYAVSLLSGETGGYMVDWNNVALYLPGEVSVREELVLSAFAYLYYGVVMWLLLTGLLLLFLVSDHYRQIYSDSPVLQEPVARKRAREHGEEITSLTFSCAILSLLFGIMIRLQSTYLITTEENIFRWLLDDTRYLLGVGGEPVVFLDNRSIPQVTVLLLLAAVWIVFVASLLNTRRGRVELSCSGPSYEKQASRDWRITISVMMLLSLALLAIGTIDGFSVLLIPSVLLSVYSAVKMESNRRKIRALDRS